MGITFNIDEVFELAEQIERNGAKFYRKAAEAAGNEDARDLLLSLAVMEDEHEATFKAMRAEVAADEKAATIYDPEGQSAAYLRAMASGHVFDMSSDPSEKLTGSETLQDILADAINAEKNSIVFYLGIKDVVPEKLGKEKIEPIIKEEMSHITLLVDKISALG